MRRHFATWALVAWAAFYGTAWGQECSQTIEGNDLIQYSVAEVRVSSDCDEVTITLRHVGQLPANVMGHNWVLTTTADYTTVASAAQAAGPPNYVPEGDPRIIGATNMIGGGEEASAEVFVIDTVRWAGLCNSDSGGFRRPRFYLRNVTREQMTSYVGGERRYARASAACGGEK